MKPTTIYIEYFNGQTYMFDNFDEIIHHSEYNDIKIIDCSIPGDEYGDPRHAYLSGDIVELPNPLPNKLQILNCMNNQIIQLSNLPDTLLILECCGNKIKDLPDLLPSNLEILNCDWNELTQLPEQLPPNFTV